VYLRTNFAILQNHPLQLKTEALMHDVKTVREPACVKKTALDKPAIQDRPGSSNLQAAVQRQR
jgi:hypothetical protein